MTGRLAAIWRHPVKSHGREALDRVMLKPGEALPGDRAFAVAREEIAAGAWAPCGKFQIAANIPALQQIAAETLPGGRLRLTHPALPPLTFAPATPEGADAFLTWAAPLTPAGYPRPVALHALPGRGYTDTDYPSVSLISLATHRAVEAAMGRSLEPLRWRGNLLLDGLEPWAEWEWIGREIGLGPVRLRIRERIRRCMATKASPVTGLRDADTLGTLEAHWGHRDMGVYAEVITGGEIAPGAELAV